MGRNRIIAALLSLVLFCVSNSVLAATVEPPVSMDRKIVIKGNIGEAAEGVPVTLLVLRKGKTASDLREALQLQEETALYAAILSLVCYLDETASDPEGNFVFRFVMDESCTSGDYIAFIGGSPFRAETGGSIEGTIEQNIEYIPIQEKIKAVKALNASLNSGSAADFETAMETYYRELSLFSGDMQLSEMFEKVKSQPGFFILLKERGTYEETEEAINDSLSRFRKNFTDAVLFQSIEIQEDEEKLEQLITSYAKQLGLRLDGVSKENKSHVYNRIAKLTEIKSAETIQVCIDEAVVLYQMNHANKWGDVKRLITEQKDYLGIDLKNPGTDYDAIYHILFQEREGFQTIQEITERFQKLVPLHPVTKPTNRPSGSGGGGGFPSLPVSSVTPAPTPTSTPTALPTGAPEIHFDDVTEDHWAAKVIDSLAKQGLMKGKEEGKFMPEEQITREEFVTILLRSIGEEAEPKETRFSDVQKSDWFSGYVEKASELGLVKGYSDGSFGAGQEITRQDMAVLLLKAAEITGKELPVLTSPQKFTDDGQIADYAKTAVTKLQQAKIINGMEDGSFAPSRYATRAEAAQILFSILSLIQ
jgi:S-layer domain protein